MEAENINQELSKLNLYRWGKYLRFISEKSKTTCEECKKYDKMVFAEDDPSKPAIPIHSNCKCHYKTLNLDITLTTAKFRVPEPQTGFLGKTITSREEFLEKLETGFAPGKVKELIIINHGEDSGVFELGSRAESFDQLTDSQIRRLKHHLAPNALIDLRMCGGIEDEYGEKVVQDMANKLQCRIKAYTNAVSPFGTITRLPINPNSTVPWWQQLLDGPGGKIFYPQK